MLFRSQWEYHNLIRKSGVNTQMVPGMFLGITLYIVSTLVSSGVLLRNSFLVLIPLISFIFIRELYRREDKPFDSLAHTFFSVIYCAVPFSMFPFSAFSHQGLDSLLQHEGITFSPGIVIGFFLLIWANDTGAYLVGRSIGRHKLMERISPAKTMEGFLGGVIFAATAAWLLSGWLGAVDTYKWIIISVIVSFTGTCGDLIESMLKRSAGVKDSGSILPGHGGFLDRFDSAIISFPIVYLFISLFG